MKQFLIVIACCICNLTVLSAETTDEIIEQATKRLQTYQSFEHIPYRLAFSAFIDNVGYVNITNPEDRVANFDNELSILPPPDLECSLRYLAPDKYRIDIVARNSKRTSVVISGNSIQTNGKRKGHNEDSLLTIELKRIVEFMDVRGPKDLLANHRNYTVIDGGDTTIDGIKCRSITFRQSDLRRTTLYFNIQKKDLMAAKISFPFSKDCVTITYKYDSVAWPEEVWLVGYPMYIKSKRVVDNMRFEFRSFKKIENADEGILKIE